MVYVRMTNQYRDIYHNVVLRVCLRALMTLNHPNPNRIGIYDGHPTRAWMTHLELEALPVHRRM